MPWMPDNQLLDPGLVGILAIQEFGRELQHAGVQRDVEAVGGLVLQVIQIELELLRPQGGGQRRAEGQGSYGSHCSVPFNCICTRFSLLPAIRMAVITCSLATCP